MSTLAVLEVARNLIADPEHWARDSYALDAAGEPVSPWDPRAMAWCAHGAVMKVHEDTRANRLEVWRLLEAAALRGGYRGVLHANRMGHAVALSICA